jgi:hypothetical protein
MVDRSLSHVASDGDAGSSADTLETGFELLLAAVVVGEALAAVDFDALRAGAPLERAVDADTLGAALGRPAGHLLARRAIGDAAGDGLAGTVGREAGARVGARVVEIAVERFEYSS